MTFAWEAFDGQRMLMLHGAEDPPVLAWDEYIGVLRGRDVSRLGLLVFTDGGAPNAAQRRSLNEVLAGRYFARAVVHDNPVVRGVIAAVSWFAPGVRPFSPKEWRVGARHAGFEAKELHEVARRLRGMNDQLRQKIPWLDATLAL